MEDPETLILFLDARGHAFQEVMPLAMRNLATAQHRDKARFRIVWGGTGGWDRPRTEVKEGDFVLVKRQVLGGLDIATNPHYLACAASEGEWSGGVTRPGLVMCRGARQKCGTLFFTHQG